MKLNWKPFTLNLKTTFRIAHGASDKRENVIVYLDEGIGEAAVVPYYGYSQDDIFKYLARLEPGNWNPYLFYSILKSLPAGPQAARAAVDIALHDVWGCLGKAWPSRWPHPEYVDDGLRASDL